MKKCSKCNEIKSLDNYTKHKTTKDKLTTQCKACVKIRCDKWLQNNKSRSSRVKRKWQEDNKIKVTELAKNRYEANKDDIKLAVKSYKKNNKGKINAMNAKRRALKINATPKWLTEFDLIYIKSIYQQGSFLEMHVDHIVPLKGNNVCGLHVPWNLQLLEPEENLKKSNKF